MADDAPGKLAELEPAMAALAQAQIRIETRLDRLEADLQRYAAERFGILDRHAAAATRASLDRLDAKTAAILESQADAVSRAGRLVEDIIAPALPELFRELFSWQGPLASGIRARRGDDERGFEAYAVGGDHFLLLSARGTAAASDIADLLAILPAVRDYFPEAANRKVHGAFGTVHADPSVIAGAERCGIYVIGLRLGITTVLNSQGFTPAAF